MYTLAIIGMEANTVYYVVYMYILAVTWVEADTVYHAVSMYTLAVTGVEADYGLLCRVYVYIGGNWGGSRLRFILPCLCIHWRSLGWR